VAASVCLCIMGCSFLKVNSKDFGLIGFILHVKCILLHFLIVWSHIVINLNWHCIILIKKLHDSVGHRYN